jgi:hypothetical protein
MPDCEMKHWLLLNEIVTTRFVARLFGDLAIWRFRDFVIFGTFFPTPCATSALRPHPTRFPRLRNVGWHLPILRTLRRLTGGAGAAAVFRLLDVFSLSGA